MEGSLTTNINILSSTTPVVGLDSKFEGHDIGRDSLWYVIYCMKIKRVF